MINIDGPFSIAMLNSQRVYDEFATANWLSRLSCQRSHCWSVRFYPHALKTCFSFERTCVSLLISSNHFHHVARATGTHFEQNHLQSSVGRCMSIPHYWYIGHFPLHGTLWKDMETPSGETKLLVNRLTSNSCWANGFIGISPI